MDKEFTGYPEQKEIITCIEQPNGLQEIEVIEAVRCSRCRTLIDRSSEKYLTIKGNLFIGEGGGILGNGDWKRHGIPFHHFCINGCFSNYILEQERDELHGIKRREPRDN
jgi:hypothetical protein